MQFFFVNIAAIMLLVSIWSVLSLTLDIARENIVVMRSQSQHQHQKMHLHLCTNNYDALKAFRTHS